MRYEGNKKTRPRRDELTRCTTQLSQYAGFTRHLNSISRTSSKKVFGDHSSLNIGREPVQLTSRTFCAFQWTSRRGYSPFPTYGLPAMTHSLVCMKTVTRPSHWPTYKDDVLS